MPKTKTLRKKFISLKTYASLRSQIRKTIALGKERAVKAVEHERVRTYWEVGELIQNHILLKQGRADYGKNVIKRLSVDLRISPTQIYYMVEFSRAYKIFPHGGKLPWSHYKALLSINDDEQRMALTNQAATNNWTRDVLRAAIKKVKAESVTSTQKHVKQTEPRITIPERRKPGVHKITKWRGKTVRDLGFTTYLEINANQTKSLSSSSRPPARQSIPIKSGMPRDLSTSLEMTGKKNPKPTELYYYKAVLDRVVDGDTIRADINLGFGIWSYQILRLRGIDAPELGTRAGKASKRFLEKHLKKADNILIRSSRSDKYDRYLADVWVDDIYINQALVDQGFASRMK